MGYPHYPFFESGIGEEEEEDGRRFKPKMVLYAVVIISAFAHYFLSFSLFTYVAAGFFAYALYKLVTCGCWKAQLRFVAGVMILLLSLGFLWKPILSLGTGLMAFEMFL